MKYRALVISLLLGFLGPVSAEDSAVVSVDFQPGPTGNAFSILEDGGAGATLDSIFWNAVEPLVDGYTSSWGSGGNFAFSNRFDSGLLKDSTGKPTPMTVTIYRGTPLGTTFAVNPSNTWAYEHVAVDARSLMAEYLIAPGGGTNAVDFNHLVPGNSYTLFLYGAGDQDTHQTTFVIDGWSKTTSGVRNEQHSLTIGSDYVVFKGVTAPDGPLTIHYFGAGSSRDGNFNGFQIQGNFHGVQRGEDTAEKVQGQP